MPSSSQYTAKSANAQGYIHYTPVEHETWQILFTKQLPAVKTFASLPYLKGLQRLELTEQRIPQCQEISDKLATTTGWKIKPVSALIDFKQFFTLLSQQTFPAASFMRCREDLEYLKEPDLFHEIFGHTPLLTQADFASFTQSIGVLGCQLEPKYHAWLARIYWMTIEFGLIKEEGELKAYGAGLMSSSKELPHALFNPHVERKTLNVEEMLRTPYRIDKLQNVYFVINDFKELFELTQRDLILDIINAEKAGLYSDE